MKKILLLVALLLTTVHSWADDQGACGDGVSYVYSDSTQTLTISRTGNGTGAMWDNREYGTPWYSYCREISKVVIGDGVTSIGNRAFHYCSSLTSITIPPSVSSIGLRAFSGCRALTSITISANVTSIGDGAFSSCSLTSIVVEEGNAVYDSRNNCNAIIRKEDNMLIQGCMNTEIPASVTSIGIYGFSGCGGLTSITIPDNVVSIGNYAFNYCSGLTSVVIGNGIESIGNSAFGYCGSSISDVYCYAETVPNSSTDAFNNSNPGQITLHVPAASVAEYKGTSPWSSFKDVVPLTNEDPRPSGINTIDADQKEERWYTLDGKQIETPQKGLNIVRMGNGKTIKVLIK